jgi:bacterial leucyl aminopeptidase
VAAKALVLLLLSSSPAFAGEGGGTAELAKAKARARSVPSVAGKEASPAPGLWASFSEGDLDGLRDAGVPLDEPAVGRSGAAVFRIREDDLPAIAHVMHERFKRCGGFFAHEDRSVLEKAPQAVRALAEGYTLDQQAWVSPAVAKAKESEVRATIESLAAFNNRYYQADTGVAAAEWIKGRWAGLAKGVPGASARLIPHKSWKQPSVALTLPGSSEPDEVVVLGGHLDSISGWGNPEARAPGADDNASGIAVLTEAIRILADSGFKPRRTVEFMGYAAEEVGLRGSQDIAARYAAEGKKVVGVVQFDMTNFKGSADMIYLLQDHVDPALTAFLGKLVETYAGGRWGTLECGYACSDHASWTRSGFPASAAFESTMEDMNGAIHTSRDTLATSGGTAEHSVKFARLAAAFAAELAKQRTGFIGASK